MKMQMLALLVLCVIACAPQLEPTPGPETAVTSPPGWSRPGNEPSANPFVPQPGDPSQKRSLVYIREANLVIRESFLPQISLALAGDLPTPCNQLRVEVSPPDAESRILVDVYSVVDPNQLCVQVLERFEESIDLESFSTGHYTVWVNGKRVGEFDS